MFVAQYIHLDFMITSDPPFSVPRFLETYEDEFVEIVDPKHSLPKLKHKGVISQCVRTDIESASDEDAKYILLEHLRKYATLHTLRLYCEVAIAANGYPRMQELGRRMMAALPPGGWLDLWLCMCECGLVCVHVCVLCVCVHVCELEYTLSFVSRKCVCMCV